MIHLIIIAICICFASHTQGIAQSIDSLPYPIVNTPTINVYISTQGIDSNNSEGSREKPVQSFSKAFALLQNKTKSIKGNISCGINVLPGRYILTDILEQDQLRYMPEGEKGRKLDISIIGEGNPIIDGINIKKTGGYGLVRLCGSHITITGITIKNSPSYALVLGQPFARSTNVEIRNVIIDSTYDHGILIGDVQSSIRDTVLITQCRITETNRKNEYGAKNQWGSALKLFGASSIIIDSCYLHRNWGEAICINSSSRVEVRNTTVFDNWGPAVYCDISNSVKIYRNQFISTADSTIVMNGKRGMVGIMLSNEAWDPFQQECNTENIDIFSNLFLNCSGIVDIWEGTVSFLQVARIRNIRFAHNSIYGLKTGKNNQNVGVISAVFSSPYPINRQLQNILIYGNIMSVNPDQWGNSLWVRSDTEPLQYITFKDNRWHSQLPLIGNHSMDDTGILHDSIDLQNLDFTPSMVKKVKTLAGIEIDYFGRKRNPDSTLAGAFEWSVNSITEYPEQYQNGMFGIYEQEFVVVNPANKEREFMIVTIDGKVSWYKLLAFEQCLYLPSKGPLFIIEKK